MGEPEKKSRKSGVMIRYSEDASVSPVELAELFRSSGIQRPVDDLDRLALMLQRADLVIAAHHDNRLVGIARALTDFCYCCYLSDLAVSGDFQHQGIGRALVDRVRARIGPQSNLVLLSAEGAMGYYPKLGFSPISHGWFMKRSW